MEERTRKVCLETNMQVDSPKIPYHVNCHCVQKNAKTGDVTGRLSRMVSGMIESMIFNQMFEPIRIIKSGPATVVFWKDGTKTVVKCAPETAPSDYDAFTAALAIKIFGNNSRLKKMIKVLTVVENPNKKKVKKPAEPAETAVQEIEAVVEE